MMFVVTVTALLFVQLASGCCRKGGSHAERMAIGGGTKFSCPEVEVVTREEWGARSPRGVTKLSDPVSYMFVHHTAMDSCSDKEECIKMMRKIQDFHMDDRGWDDIGYNFLVGEDGRVYVARGWLVEGAHTYGYNRKGHAVSIMGTFMDRKPNQRALDATKRIIQCGVEKGFITDDYELFGHRDAGCTSCPGNALQDIIKTWPHYTGREIKKYCWNG